MRVHTHTAQPQPNQNRADHGHATNLTDPTGLCTSPGSPELTQVACFNAVASSHTRLSSADTKLMRNPYFSLKVSHCRVVLAEFLFSPRFRTCAQACMRPCLCVHVRTSCGSDVGFGCDRRACRHAGRVCRQDVPLQQMRVG